MRRFFCLMIFLVFSVNLFSFENSTQMNVYFDEESVYIINGQIYTSPHRAESFVRRGLAEWKDNKQSIQFTIENQASRIFEQEFKKNRGDVVFWNGDSKDPCAMFKPGEIVS